MNIFKKLTAKTSNDSETSAHIEQDKEIRENMTEKQADKMVADSFPASDPASTY